MNNQITLNKELLAYCSSIEIESGLRYEKACELISQGANPNGYSFPSNDWTAIHFAAKWGHEELFALLFSHGASLCGTVLHAAAVSKKVNKTIMNILIKNQIPVDSADEEGSTPLHWACGTNYSSTPKNVKFLLRHGASPAQTNEEGKTPIDVAVEYGNDKLAEWIKSYDPDTKSFTKSFSKSADMLHEDASQKFDASEEDLPPEIFVLDP